MSNKQGKMINFINWRMRVMLLDNRQMTGQMLAFDKHMNLVLADTEEFRFVKRKQPKTRAPGSHPTMQVVQNEEKRTLGLIILRGEQLVSVVPETSPPSDPSARLKRNAPGGIPSTLAVGPGVAKPAGRGAPPPSLTVRLRVPSKSSSEANVEQGPAAGVGSGPPPPGFPGFQPPGQLPFGRGGPPAGFPPNMWPPPGFPGNFAGPPSFNAPVSASGGAPGGAPTGPAGGPPGAPPGTAPGFNPPPRR